jgi:hypothetical protein
MAKKRKIAESVRKKAEGAGDIKDGATISKLTSHIKNKVARSEAYNKLKQLKKVQNTFILSLNFIYLLKLSSSAHELVSHTKVMHIDTKTLRHVCACTASL